jgi:hypothetical protein
MKKIVPGLLAFFISLTNLHAQTFKGDWMVGGNFSLNTTSNTSVSLNPSAGYFFLDNLAIGGTVNFGYLKTGNVKTTLFGAGPYVRYYFGKGNLKPFAVTEFLFSSSKVDGVAATSSTKNGHEFLLGAGLAAFVNEHVAIETIAGYTNTKYSGTESDGGLAIRIGFQVYLSPHKMVETYKQGR